jgi:chemotaxis protein methyltransferase CheR
MGVATTEVVVPHEREFRFVEADFIALRDLVREVTGISLTDAKRELVYSRIARRLRILGLDSFAAYRELLRRDAGGELVEFCNAMTTNLTAFFREGHHFENLRDRLLLPRLADAHGSRRLRFWCAGCSSGEEPYSLAMTLCEAIPDWKRWDIRILATDIDSQILATAARGAYSQDRTKGLSPARLQTFFTEHDGERGPQFQVSSELAGLVTFRQLNLMHPLPMSGPLDAVFCRNVIIYFDRETQRNLFARIAPLQRPGDLLFLGHSESLFKVTEAYALLGRTAYRRVGA